MGVFKKLLLVALLSLSATLGLSVISTPAEARWTFDALPPTTTLTQPATQNSLTTLKATSRDNNPLSTNNKEFIFLIAGARLTPGALSSYNECPSSPRVIEKIDTPCKITVSGNAAIRQGADNKTLDIEQSGIEFRANTAATFYIYGRLLQDEAGNTGTWDNTPESISPPPTNSSLLPFIQTREGDVHSNEGINTPGGPQ